MNDIVVEYRKRHGVLRQLAEAVDRQLREYFEGEVRIDRIQARAKSVDRFVEKASKIDAGQPKYAEPLHQIQDQVGARIVTFYLSDVPRVCNIVEKYFRQIETRAVVPDTE